MPSLMFPPANLNHCVHLRELHGEGGVGKEVAPSALGCIPRTSEGAPKDALLRRKGGRGVAMKAKSGCRSA